MSHVNYGVNGMSSWGSLRGSDHIYTTAKMVSSSIFTVSTKNTTRENISVHVIYGVTLSHNSGYL